MVERRSGMLSPLILCEIIDGQYPKEEYAMAEG